MLVRSPLGGWCLALVSTLLSIATLGCDSDDAAPDCAPGASVACRGAGDCAGGQVCQANGHSFGECVCGAPVGPADDGGSSSNAGRGGARADGGEGGTTSTDGGTDRDAGGGSSAGEDAGEDAGGAGDDAGTDAGQDAGVDFGSFSCNPLTDAGCADDERCSWVQDGDGETRCLSDGSKSAGQACTTDGDGVDDCERGSICIDDACARVCELGDFAMCAPEGYCVSYAGIFQEGDQVLAGACRLGCDPVTQLTTEDEACGEDLGCYYLQSESGTIASCVGTNATSEARTQDVPIPGTVFSNSCAPGFAAITDADGDPICTALCTPVETWSGSTANIGGEAPHTCASRGAGAGYECRFASYFAKFDHADPLLNTIGLCVNPDGRLWDSNGNGTPETPWPSCADLANTDTDDDDVRDHEKWGCAPVMP